MYSMLYVQWFSFVLVVFQSSTHLSSAPVSAMGGAQMFPSSQTGSIVPNNTD